MLIKRIHQRLSLVIVTFACSSALATSPPSPAPQLKDLANATYQGIREAQGAITLSDGEWQGEPWVEGGVSAPSVQLVGTLVAHADLDDDGRTESVNFVNYSTGGTGQLLHLAVSRFGEAGVENFATVFLGDRVMVRDLSIENGRILADLVQAGPSDGACCPGDVVTRIWRMENGQLQEEVSNKKPVRLSVNILEGSEWALSRWGFNEPVEDGITVTLEYLDGRFTGQSSCNRYFAGVSAAGDIAGGIEVAGVGGTRMLCADGRLSAAEERYLVALQQVNRISFIAGEMLLSWGQGSKTGSLYFSQTSSTLD
jgi:heat shock protein HslJ